MPTYHVIMNRRPIFSTQKREKEKCDMLHAEAGAKKHTGVTHFRTRGPFPCHSQSQAWIAADSLRPGRKSVGGGFGKHMQIDERTHAISIAKARARYKTTRVAHVKQADGRTQW